MGNYCYCIKKFRGKNKKIHNDIEPQNDQNNPQVDNEQP